MYNKHYSIIVTGRDRAIITKAHNKAHLIFGNLSNNLFGNVISNIVSGMMNSQYSFFIAPDGVDYVGNTADMLTSARFEFVNYLRSKNIDFVKVMFGGDDDVCRIIDKI